MMQAQVKKNGYAALFVFVVIAVSTIIGIPGLDLTKPQEITVAILCIAAVLWIVEWVPLFVVSFLILALEIVWLFPALQDLALADNTTLFFDAFFSNIILLFLGGFVLASLMQKYGLDIRFAQAILKRTHGNASYTLLGIILACAFLSMWISNTATTAMMLTIIFPLLKRIPSDHTFKIALVLSIPFACNIGGIGTPIGSPPNAIALSYLAQKGIQLSFLQWMLLTLPFLLAFLFFLWQLLLRLYPAKSLILQIESRATGEFGIKQIAAVCIFCFTAVGWFAGGYIGLKSGTIALFPIICCFWFGLLDTSDFRTLPWDILYIISGGLALGTALTVSGLGTVLVSSLPQDPITLFMLGVVVAATLSTIMSNTATAGLIIPLVIALDISNPMLVSVVVSLAMASSLSMALPVTTPPNAIAFSSRVIASKDMMLAGSIITLVGVISILLFGPMYWTFILQ